MLILAAILWICGGVLRTLWAKGKGWLRAGRILNLSRAPASRWGYGIKVRNGLPLEPTKIGANTKLTRTCPCGLKGKRITGSAPF